jgi:HEAT repeat protein
MTRARAPHGLLGGLGVLALLVASPPAAPAGGRDTPAPAPRAERPAGNPTDLKGAIAGLAHPDPNVRAEAARRLGGMHFSQFDPIGADDVVILARVLREGDVPARRAAAQTFSMITHGVRGGEVSRAALPALGAALKDPDPAVAAGSAIALGHMRAPEAMPMLIEALADPRPSVVGAAGAAVGHLTNERNAILLIPALRHPSAREAVASLLAGVKSPPFRELDAALGGQDLELKRGSAYALSRIADPAVKGPLTGALSDGDPEVRLWAVTGLGVVGDPSVGAPLARLLDDPDQRVRRAAATSLRVGGPPVVDALLDHLETPDVELQRRVVISLAAIGDPRGAERLLELLPRASPEIAEVLVSRLGHWKGNKDLLRGLIAALGSGSDTTRTRAAKALTIANNKVTILGREAVPPLVAVLKSPDVGVRRAAAISLRSLAGGGILTAEETGPLTAATADSDPQVRQHAARALAQLQPQRTGPPR